MQDSDGSKNFLGKNFKNFADGATIFDFTYYRLHGVGIFDDSLFDACTDEEYESALEEWEGEIPDREDF